MKYILGPEFIWMVIYFIARTLSKMNKAPDYPWNNFIEQCWIWVPLVIVVTFGLFWISGMEKNWLLLRIWIVGLIMSHMVLNTILIGYSDQGPGIGMVYIMGIIFVFLVLIVGSIIVKWVH